ncbi:MAG: RNA methyltransferase [Clostridia bacterium]|nr:RNA methyltransferase [Clostridia bacterium]
MRLTNNEIKFIKKLKDKKYRKVEGLFLVEGSKLCEEVLNSSYQIKYTITSNEFKYNDFPNVYVVDYDVIKTISTTDTPQDIVCVVHIPHQEFDYSKGNSLILDNLQDPGNIGTLIRSAMAFGFNDIYFIDCPDIYSEKVVRGSMGGIFKINAHIISRQELIKNKARICDILLSTTLNADILGKNHLPKSRIGVIIGNEGNGVSTELIQVSDMAVKIPMTDMVESLNAGVAGSILMYEMFKGEN